MAQKNSCPELADLSADYFVCADAVFQASGLNQEEKARLFSCPTEQGSMESDHLEEVRLAVQEQCL